MFRKSLTTSAISSGVRGSQPLRKVQLSGEDELHTDYSRIDCVGFCLVSIETNDGKFLD